MSLLLAIFSLNICWNKYSKEAQSNNSEAAEAFKTKGSGCLTSEIKIEQEFQKYERLQNKLG